MKCCSSPKASSQVVPLNRPCREEIEKPHMSAGDQGGGCISKPPHPRSYCFCLSERESLRCFSDKETCPKLYIYELVTHKLAAVGWQSLQRAMPAFAFSHERLTRKGCACRLELRNPVP